MTRVVTPPFTVQIVSASNPYAGWSVGQRQTIFPLAGLATIDPRVMSYSGTAYDPVTGTIYAFGGGHEVNNNEVWRFGVDVPGQWQKDYNATHPNYPNAPDTFTQMMADTSPLFPGKWMSVNRPISRHSRRTVEWVSSQQAFTAGSQSTFSGNNDEFWTTGYGNDCKDNWLYYPGTKTWDWKGSVLVDPTKKRFGADTWYHSTRDRVYTFDYVSNVLWIVEWNPAANTWRTHAPQTSWTGSASMALDLAKDRFLMFDGTNAKFYSLNTETWSSLTLAGSTPSGLSESDSFFYSPATGFYTYMKADGSLYKGVLSGTTLAWSSWGFSIPNMSSGTGKGRIANHCPTRGVTFFTYVNSATTGVDVFAAKV